MDDSNCDHMDAALDILTGRLVCDCGFTKWLTNAEFTARMDFEQRAQAAYDEYVAGVEAEESTHPATRSGGE